ncbi:NADH dehydrogenase subunit A [Geoalkalibacter ferrihydriticus]|uniref:NADH-quinone oxidoreductase subunit A n=2 Tax=Geoalkalibacter ferrihydriticus TaxID=392333 RepID=A0A0C2HY05_9BACT|nr:NADH-quinone oxidoreductase subunit A [Geoalkalibacter ferrihydriticus]KIH77617.1 NADH-quinone oxidoreductase [Geoalkalibacter ferrihydriticus DSM 17813]SDL70367.1 NADH dehydrogenase subunit A [Geoalkalibacter ferrihydriticus]
MLDAYLPILVLIGIALAFALGSVIFSGLIGMKKRNPSPVKFAPYECGLPPVGSARERVSIKFYLVAVAFIVFDLEMVFLYPWAVVFKQLGLYGAAVMGVFVFVLIVGFIYDWKKGALEWE